MRCRSIASGVVRTTGRTSPPTRLSTVPRSPGRRPAAVRIAWRRNAVVVFPFVPVTPATSSSRVGSPKNTSAAVAIAARADGTTSCGTSGSTARSTTSATAPFATAWAAKSWPSARSPGTAEECRAGGDGTRVVGEVAHLDRVGAAEDRLRCERGDEALELHCGGTLPRGHGAGAASGATSSSTRLERAISAKAGAATTPPQIAPRGSSIETSTTSRGSFAGTTPTNDATYFDVE